MKLHGYFRSSAAYRVRIALNLKGLLPRAPAASPSQGRTMRARLSRDQPAGAGSDAGERRRRDPHPVARHHRMAGRDLSQARRYCRRIRCAAPRSAPSRMALACDTHPVQNLKVLARLRAARPAGGKGDGVGGLGQPRRACRPAKP